MKTKTLSRQLIVKKETVANLSEASMNQMKGGAAFGTFTNCYNTVCPDKCPLPDPSWDDACFSLITCP